MFDIAPFPCVVRRETPVIEYKESDCGFVEPEVIEELCFNVAYVLATREISFGLSWAVSRHRVLLNLEFKFAEVRHRVRSLDMLFKAFPQNLSKFILGLLASRTDIHDGFDGLLTKVVELLVATPHITRIDLHHFS